MDAVSGCVKTLRRKRRSDAFPRQRGSVRSTTSLPRITGEGTGTGSYDGSPRTSTGIEGEVYNTCPVPVVPPTSLKTIEVVPSLIPVRVPVNPPGLVCVKVARAWLAIWTSMDRPETETTWPSSFIKVTESVGVATSTSMKSDP